MGDGVKGADDVCARLVEAAVAPQAAAALARRAPGGGAARWTREEGGASAAFFDLASVTKSFVAVAAARAEGGALPKAALADVLPEAAGSALARVPLERLLAHRAGLEAHLAVYAPLVTGGAVTRADALERVLGARRADVTEDVATADASPLYSDLGYWLVGEALAHVTGPGGLDEALRRHVLAPLGVCDAVGSARVLGTRAVDFGARVVPTEHVPWRGGLVRGQVHDENAWALSGLGVSGHAGLFGTAAGVLAFGPAVLDALEGRGGPFGDGPSLELLVRPRAGGTLRAGFDGKSAEGSAAGARAGPRTFGHLGFTGTSLFVDPDRAAVVVLLTNRVCPTRANLAIRAARPAAHDALFARAEALGSPTP